MKNAKYSCFERKQERKKKNERTSVKYLHNFRNFNFSWHSSFLHEDCCMKTHENVSYLLNILRFTLGVLDFTTKVLFVGMIRHLASFIRATDIGLDFFDKYFHQLNSMQEIFSKRDMWWNELCR